MKGKDRCKGKQERQDRGQDRRKREERNRLNGTSSKCDPRDKKSLIIIHVNGLNSPVQTLKVIPYFKKAKNNFSDVPFTKKHT